MRGAIWRKARRRGRVALASSLNSLARPLFGMAVSVLVVRLASVDLWGAFVDALIVVQLAAAVMAWGNQEFLLREFSRRPAEAAALWWRSLATRGLLLAAYGMVLVALGWRGPRFWLGLGWGAGLLAYRSFDVWVVYRRAFAWAFGVEAFATAGMVAMVLWLGSALTVEALMALFALAAALKSAAMFWRFRHALALRFPRDIALSSHRLRRRRTWIDPGYFAAAFPFFLLSFSGMLQSRIDLYSVSFWLGPEEVGRYQVYINLLLYAQAVAAFVLTPFVKGLYRLDDAAIRRGVSRRLLALGALLMGPFLLALYVALAYLYRIELPDIFYTLAILYVLPIYYYLPKIYGLYRQNLQHIVLFVNITGFLMNLLLNAFLLPRVGLVGAILSTSTTLVRWAAFGFYWRVVDRWKGPGKLKSS
ncbi:MAG: hypothetical protein GXP42_13530 [Chloroflexi bacterium]|nr:hypothetical protein [Chloroflexota bacterium]